MARTIHSKRLSTCILFFTLLGTGVSSFAASTQEDVVPVRNVSPGIFPSSIIVNDVFSNDGPGIDYTVTGSVTKEEEKEPEKLSYCVNIHEDAKEARSAILKERLIALEMNVDDKLEKLEKRIAVLKKWTKKREDFLVAANESLVQIFQNMRPDAAALQFTEMGPGMAAAIISKLEPKYSSAILTEMKPSDAAKIALVLTNLMGMEKTSVN
ncbi:MAG: MotE family protein [Pseudomonadota bacterium]